MPSFLFQELSRDTAPQRHICNIIWPQSLLHFGASGRLCFMIVTFPGCLHLYSYKGRSYIIVLIPFLLNFRSSYYLFRLIVIAVVKRLFVRSVNCYVLHVSCATTRSSSNKINSCNFIKNLYNVPENKYGHCFTSVCYARFKQHNNASYLRQNSDNARLTRTFAYRAVKYYWKRFIGFYFKHIRTVANS